MQSNVLTKVFTSALVNPCPSPSKLWHHNYSGIDKHHIHNSSINYVLHLYLHYKSLLYIPLLHLFYLLFICMFCLYIRLNQFYLSSHSCFALFSLALLNTFFFVSLYFSSFFALSLSLSPAIPPYFLFIIFLSFFILHPHRFFLTLSYFAFYFPLYTPRWRSSFQRQDKTHRNLARNLSW